MSVYPVFTYESIQQRYLKDITEFTKRNAMNVQNRTKFLLPFNGVTKNSITSNSISKMINKMKIHITNICDIIDKHLRTSTHYRNSVVYEHGHKMDNSYVANIKYVTDPVIQNKLFIARHFLFFQLLAYTTALCMHKELFDAIFNNEYKKTLINMGVNPVLVKELYTFRPEVSGILDKITMGLFGSMNPTSDIDLGIETGNIGDITPPLTYVMCVLESLFQIFTGKSNLMFDIECYVNALTLPNPPEYASPDYFYLDMSKFTINEFKLLLPIVGAAIIRNFIMVYLDIPFDKDKLSEIKNAIEKLTFMEIINTLGYQKFFYRLEDAIQTELQNTEWFETSKLNALQFVNLSPVNQQYEYYSHAFTIENKKKEYTSIKNASKRVELTPEQTLDIIKAWGNAGLYKYENYIYTGTIVHIVRILQGQKDKVEKYKTTTPDEYCSELANTKQNVKSNAFCTLNEYSFVLSMIEQIGYEYRFYLTYCLENTSDAICLKKTGKYQERITNAYQLYENITNKKWCNKYEKSKVNKMKSNSLISPNSSFITLPHRNGIINSSPAPAPAAAGGNRKKKCTRKIKRTKKSKKTIKSRK